MIILRLPRQHDIVREKFGEEMADDTYRNPQHNEDCTAEDHHGGHKTPDMPVNWQMYHLQKDSAVSL